MNLKEFIDIFIDFAQNNPVMALIIGAVIILLIFKKPKLMLSLLILILILAGTFYVIMDMASSAKIEKQRLINESRESSEIIRK